MWDDRFSWSGEIPTTFPGLNPVALQRVTPATGKFYADTVTPARLWERKSDGALDGNTSGAFGLQIGMNFVNPATEQGRFELPNFAGLWPSSGKLLIGLWVRNMRTMGFSPLLSTRGGTSPLVYLSTGSTGRIRHGVYNAAGALVLDQYEDHPWASTTGLQFVGMLVDMTGLTSQMFSVNQETKATWLGPVRTLSGAPNAASTANLDVFGLQNSGYWTTGAFDEVLVAHPGAGFDLAAFVDSMGLGLWSDGQSVANATGFAVAEAGITAESSGTLATGAERVSWDIQPLTPDAPAGAVPYWSTDGAAWATGALPESFTGLLRWEVPMDAGETFAGFDIIEPTTPAPTLGPISNIAFEQGDLTAVPLSFTVDGAPVWSVNAPDIVAVSVTDGIMSVVAGFAVGAASVTVTLSDSLGRTASRTFTVTVAARAFDAGDPPQYPNSPIILWGDSQPEAVLIDPVGAVVTKEINGEHKLDLMIPAGHKHAGLIVPENVIEVAGERYRTRRIVTARQGRKVMLEVYAEARFYDLATAGQIPAQEWTQTTAGAVMQVALAGTGWTVAVANVTTRRTYSVEDTNPLALLRTVQEQHGGELVFDNINRRVSLVVTSGRDKGVGFFYGKGLTDAKRVVDTTSLITRIYARNADGLTIAGVNGGKSYVEDFAYTSEVRSATYDFKSGTSPYTMLSMAQATLAHRSTPDYSYEVTVSDMSARSADDLDRFDAGDRVTVVDPDVGISETQRIVRLEYDVVRPWASGITLSAKLRELGGAASEDAGVLGTGAGVDSFDLVPFNLLLNGRFDNGLAHWASFGATVVAGTGTGDRAARFSGPGERWIEQTVQPDNRDAYALSFDLESSGPTGWVPDLEVAALVTYEDGTTETIVLDLD